MFINCIKMSQNIWSRHVFQYEVIKDWVVKCNGISHRHASKFEISMVYTVFQTLVQTDCLQMLLIRLYD